MGIGTHGPIGIFDSGVGGLTIAKEVVSRFPTEQIMYYGDTAHMPYGDKSPELIRAYSDKISEFLFHEGCSMLIIACYTASAQAFDFLSQKWEGILPVINVIDPVVNGLREKNNLKKIAIIGTRGTIRSGVFEKKLRIARPDVEIIAIQTPLLAPMIEEGFFHNDVSRAVVNAYLRRNDLEGLDAIVLGCTHYPLIKSEIEEFFGHSVEVIDASDYVTSDMEQYVDHQNLKETSFRHENCFYISDYTESFAKQAALFFNKDIPLRVKNIFES